jgi:hypothetical protein
MGLRTRYYVDMRSAYTLSLDPAFVARIDALRRHIPRSRYLEEQAALAGIWAEDPANPIGPVPLDTAVETIERTRNRADAFHRATQKR